MRGLQSHHQNSTKPPPRERRKNENSGRGKKSAKFWASHFSGHQPSGHQFSGPSAGPPSAGQPKISPFVRSLSRPHFHSFLSLWGLLVWNFGGVNEGRDPEMCTFGFTGTPVVLQNAKNNFTIDLPSPSLPPLPKKSMTNYCKFCLYPEKKASTTTERNSTGRRPSLPTFGTHTSWPSLFLGLIVVLSHRISAGRHSSPSPFPIHHPSAPHTSWPQLFWVCLSPAFGPPCSCCCVKNTPLPLLTFQNVCTAFCAVFDIFCCCLMLAFLVVRCFSCCSCCFAAALRFAVVHGVAFVLLPILLLSLLLLLCCCFVAAAAGAFKSPTVEKPISKMFLLFIL